MQAKQLCVLIPSLEPDERLPVYVDALLAADFGQIVIVNDGSSAEYDPIFASLSAKERCVVLRHDVNHGKGQALRTGVAYIRDHTDFAGIITADADGQHTPDDVAKIADALMAHPDALILGSRDKKAMPLRSKAGNTLTCGVFGLLTGLWISDTQTGLRGLPACALEAFSSLEGDRYEYEINMLIKANELKMPVEEVSIETIYIDNNSSSHFNGLKDGLKIYKLMFRQAGRFCASSVISAVIDYAMFIICHYAVHLTVVPAQIIARVISSLVNYTLNSHVVFGRKATPQSFVKYYLLAVCILACSCGGLELLTLIHVPELLAKIIVDAVLYVVSYRVQRGKIFNR